MLRLVRLLPSLQCDLLRALKVRVDVLILVGCPHAPVQQRREKHGGARRLERVVTDVYVHLSLPVLCAKHRHDGRDLVFDAVEHLENDRYKLVELIHELHEPIVGRALHDDDFQSRDVLHQRRAPLPGLAPRLAARAALERHERLDPHEDLLLLDLERQRLKLDDVPKRREKRLDIRDGERSDAAHHGGERHAHVDDHLPQRVVVQREDVQRPVAAVLVEKHRPGAHYRLRRRLKVAHIRQCAALLHAAAGATPRRARGGRPERATQRVGPCALSLVLPSTALLPAPARLERPRRAAVPARDRGGGRDLRGRGNPRVLGSAEGVAGHGHDVVGRRGGGGGGRGVFEGEVGVRVGGVECGGGGVGFRGAGVAGVVGVVGGGRGVLRGGRGERGERGVF
mmetsp:Transcript_16413/g.44035  ORF Transcript_16413/g.44035 Transcript_16413/m.44035 type:complete len:397 (+) Transcript_16413:105-1295(+)